jgi:translation initiation factor IF-3
MKKHILNDRIRGQQTRLVGHENYKNDIVKLDFAKKLAREEGLDLVLINPNEDPIICKIMDYNKFLYNQKKNNKNNNKPKIKEIKFTPNITDNDMGVKIKQARGFLEKGYTINIQIFFKGREIAHKERGEEVLFKFLDNLTDVVQFSLNVVFKGKRIIHQIRPKK